MFQKDHIEPRSQTYIIPFLFLELKESLRQPTSFSNSSTFQSGVFGFRQPGEEIVQKLGHVLLPVRGEVGLRFYDGVPEHAHGDYVRVVVGIVFFSEMNRSERWNRI